MQKGALVPDIAFVDYLGNAGTLRAYRQKENIVVIVIAGSDDVAAWEKRIQSEEKRWEWLRVRPILIRRTDVALNPGVYLIDRVAIFMTWLALEPWKPEIIENEFVYHEARHC